MFFFLRKQILKVTELIMIGNGTIFHISEMLPELFNSLSVFNSSNIHISFNFAFSLIRRKKKILTWDAAAITHMKKTANFIF